MRLSDEQWRMVVDGFAGGCRANGLARISGISRRRVYRAFNLLRRLIERTLSAEAGFPFNDRRILRRLRRGVERNGDGQAPLLIMLACNRPTSDNDDRPCWSLLAAGDGSRLDAVEVEETAPLKSLFNLLRHSYDCLALAAKRPDRPAADDDLRLRPSQPCPPDGLARCPLVRLWLRILEGVFRRGGVRDERLHLYLAEQTWQFNQRRRSVLERSRMLRELLNAWRYVLR
ncbi:MAG: hypothetical protein GF403_10925 [Candidatus Coatesbacteria bacterium]|nr:hypothetical protein [Candidatus Coatesbacteria bacterium]